MQQKQLNIGLFGLGVVGTGLVKVLESAPLEGVKIKKIGVKTPGKPRIVAESMLHYDSMDILQDPDINVIVETITGSDDAFDMVSEAMRRGKHVITSNKKMVAEHLESLILLQQNTGVSLLYESAACAAIPIVKTLESHFSAEPLSSIGGIFNGTSNYILTKMTENGLDFKEALTQAQELGFAEQDPSSDIDGLDAKYKLILLAAHSHGVLATPDAVPNFGIRNIRASDIQFTAQQGKKIKLLPLCKQLENHALAMYVMPEMIDRNHALYPVEAEFNGVELETRFSGRQFLSGRGAGSLPTGSAILSDLAVLQNGFRYQYEKHRHNGQSWTNLEVPIVVYVRAPTPALLAQLPFRQILDSGNLSDGPYAIGTIVLNWLWERRDWLVLEQLFVMRYAF
jgi:homoserine dehydrogenase